MQVEFTIETEQELGQGEDGQGEAARTERTTQSLFRMLLSLYTGDSGLTYGSESQSDSSPA